MTNPLDHDAVEANDPAVIPAPEVDPTAIVYIPENEVPAVFCEMPDDGEPYSSFEEDVLAALDGLKKNQDSTLEFLTALNTSYEGIKEGVNTIGTMMNAVAETFDGLMQQVQKGGIGALLGGFMGGKKEDG